MAWKKLIGVAALLAITGSLLALSSLPAAADGNNSGRVFNYTDNPTDGEFSTLCTVDDRTPDPYTGIGGTGLSAANCDNRIAELDIQTYSFEFVPPSDGRALLDPAGNDGLWGTSDDGRGPDGVPGTGDEPTITKRVGTLMATWTFAAGWPAPTHPGFYNAQGSRNVETLSGITLFARFRNAELQNNDLKPVCDRSNSTAANPRYIYDPRTAMHYADGTSFFLYGSWEASGAGAGSRPDQQFWRPAIGIGYYDPAIDSDFNLVNDLQTNPLYNPYNTDTVGSNPWTGLGKHYDFQLSADRKTVTLKLPAVLVETSTTCMDYGSGPNREPYWFEPYARTAADKTGSLAPRSLIHGGILRPDSGADDRLFDLYTSVGISVKPRLPVPIPWGSVLCANLCQTWEAIVPVVIEPVTGECLTCYPVRNSDQDWVIGFSGTADNLNFPDGTSGFYGGAFGTGILLTPTLGPSLWRGPTCNTPTFGGQFPNNPFWNRGNACALRNPFNIGLRPSTNHIHVF